MRLKIYTLFYNLIVKTIRLKLGLKEKTIEIDGYKIAYISSKNLSNKTLIFLHGLNDEKDTWLSLMSKLKTNYSFVAIDLLGCANSDKPTNFDYSLESQAEFTLKAIKAIVTKEKVDNYSLVGHSMGGGIAMYIANYLKIDRLILLAPLAINTKEPYIQKLAKERGELKEVPFLYVCSKEKLLALIDILYDIKPKIPNFIQEVIVAKKCKEAEFEEYKIKAIVDEKTMEFKDNLTQVAKNIKAPALLLWGIKDKVLDIKNGEVLEKLIPHSKLHSYDCGHMLQSEVPEEIAKSILHTLYKTQ